MNAQELALEAAEETEEEEQDGIYKVKTSGTEQSDTAHKREDHTFAKDPEYKNQGLLLSFGRLLAEQRHHWILYTFCILAIFAAGAVYPIQAFILANIINVFTLVGDMQKFVSEGNFWAGMFGVEAGGVGVAYFVLYLCSHLISTVSGTVFHWSD